MDGFFELRWTAAFAASTASLLPLWPLASLPAVPLHTAHTLSRRARCTHYGHTSLSPTRIAPPAAESRIKELAELVKVLRRGLKESQGRANDFIAAATRFEKEVGQQVEGVRLAAESDKRAAQVELANTRKEAAAAAARLKHELANWQVRRCGAGPGAGPGAGGCLLAAWWVPAAGQAGRLEEGSSS